MERGEEPDARLVNYSTTFCSLLIPSVLPHQPEWVQITLNQGHRYILNDYSYIIQSPESPDFKRLFLPTGHVEFRPTIDQWRHPKFAAVPVQVPWDSGKPKYEIL